MIPVHQPVFGEAEGRNVSLALSEGMISGSAGDFIEEFEGRFAEYCDCAYGVAVSSGSTALHLAAVVAGIGPGDEALVSACTNIASAAAFAHQGAIVVPIDSEPDTWNMDPSLLQQEVTDRTKAIMPVHIYGHPVDMDPVLELARRLNLVVIEDCAEAHGAEYKGRRVGSFGDMGCFSFYANKIITTGEGGMIVTNNRGYADRARSLRNLAFTEPRFLHKELGFNYRMTNLQAAVGCGQMNRIQQTIADKRALASAYASRLNNVRGLRLPVEKDYAKNVYWMFAVVIDPDVFGMTGAEVRGRLLKYGIDTRTMFFPMGRQPALIDRGAVRETDCPVADDLWENGFYLPSGTALTDKEIDTVCGALKEIRACA